MRRWVQVHRDSKITAQVSAHISTMMPGAPLLPYSFPSRIRVSYHVSGSSGSMPVKLHTCAQPATMRRPEAALLRLMDWRSIGAGDPTLKSDDIKRTSAAVARACSRGMAPLATT